MVEEIMKADESKSWSASFEKVRDFYERMPYPAPLTSLDEHRDLYEHPNRRRVQFHLLWPTEPPREDLEILVPGCGTSQAARYASREPNSRVTAIDISEMSLRHTRELQQKYDLQNLEVHKLSIEDVGRLGRTFDQIVCTGVLHHLPDPDLGLTALHDVLRPQGAMSLMVYAPYGRAGIYMMQEYCRLLGLESSYTEMKGLEDTLQALPSTHPIANAMRAGLDFKHPDSLADALLHPLDRAYSVPQLYDWLGRCGLTFGRWVEQAPYLAQCGMIANTPHAERLSALSPRLQYAAVELFRGTMVRHKFIAYRDDHNEGRNPISFEGNSWRNYIPIIVPWTVCVRERVPPGFVAVLINRAHSFTDILCTVDSWEDRLYRAIDGSRSVAEILDVNQASDERRGQKFFERLWQYDQIVVDASRRA
jgi:SAM-dependent methyltransferase